MIAALFVTKPTDSIDRISWALVWAFVDYMALQILALWLPGLIVKDVQWASLPDYRSQILLGAVRMPSVPLGLCALFGVAVAVGIVAAAFCTHDCHMWLLRRCKATLRTTHASVWADAFHGYRGGGVLVQLTNGTKLWGVPKFFADTAEEGSLLLGYPYLVGNDGTLTDREIADQILLTGATRIESVMFTPGPRNPGPPDCVSAEWGSG